MRRKHLAILVCLLSLGTGALALTRSPRINDLPRPTDQILMNRTPKLVAEKGLSALNSQQGLTQQQVQPGAAQPQQDGSIPQHVVYDELFYNVAFLKKKADDLDRQGKNSAGLRALYKNGAKLDDRQSDLLFEVASGCQRDVEDLDKRAKHVIEAFRARVEAMPIQPGQTPPPPPEELKSMQEERNATILRARDRLRSGFGEEAFLRFEEYVQHSVKPRIRTVPMKQLRGKQD
jgi:hypothetical protein